MKRSNPNAQRGAVLIIALLFLTILTILGVTAMTATTFEERMAGNTRDVGIAFQAAEAALRDARRDMNGIVIPPFSTPRNPPLSGKTGFGDGTDADNETCGATPQTVGLCRPAAYDAAAGIAPRVHSASLLVAPSVRYGDFTGAAPLTGLPVPPRYYIEVLCLPQHGGSIGDPTYCNFYRATAAGYGVNPNTRVIVQEIFLRP